MNILIINQTFYPDVAATAQQAHDLAAFLTQRGHGVRVVTSRSIYGKAGAVLPKRETADGISIYRVGFSLFGKAGIFLRILDFALFYLLASLRALTLPRADVVITLTTPPYIGLLGWAIRLLRGSRWVYWLMDLYPDVLIAAGTMKPASPLHPPLNLIGRFLLRRADAVVVLGRCMHGRVLAKNISAKHVHIISVWADTDEIRPIAAGTSSYRTEWNLQNKFVIMYSGNLGLGHDAETLFSAAQQLKDHPTIRFVFVGGGKKAEALRLFIAQHNLSNITQYPYQPREKLGSLLACADVHLVSLGSEVTGLVVPSKMFGILAAARPVIFVGSNDSEIARIINEANCGYVVANGDSAGLASLIAQLPARSDLAAMGSRGRKALDELYSRRHGCEKWEKLLTQIVAQRPRQTFSATENSEGHRVPTKDKT